MKGLKPFLSLTAGFLAFITMVGCAGSVPQNGPSPLNIAQFTLADGVIGLSYRQLLVASGGLKPYTWTISAGALPPGLNLTTDGIISGTPTTLGKFNFTAMVVDSQTPTKAANTLTATITINPVLSFVSSPLPLGLVGGSYTTTVVATNGLPPYTYALADPTNHPLPPGLTLDPAAGTISGTPTTAGVYNFTLQAQDADNEVATAAFTITVVGKLQGPYVLYFNGFDNGQPFYDVANVVTDGNGAITSGVLDQMGPGASSTSNLPITGTYSIGQTSNFGSMTLTRSDNLASLNFVIIVSNSGDTKVILSDPNAPNAYGSGALKKQTLTTISGAASYSFGMFGNDTSGGRYGGVGMFAVGAVANGSQPVTGGEEDLNDAGTVTSQNLITGGALTQSSSGSATGRGTYSLNTASGTANYVFYVVSTTELVALSTDAAGPFALVDLLTQQTAGATGSFTNATLNGQSLVSLNGLTTSGSAPSAAIGVATFDGAGNIARTDGLSAYYTDESDGGTLSTVQYTSGTYNVDPMCGLITQACGRVTVTLGDGTNPAPVWYLVNTNQAFALGTDPGVMSGTLQAQNVPAPNGFSVASVLGSYLGNTITPVSSSVTNELDVAITPPPGGIWQQHFEFSGPIGQGSQGSFIGNYDCGGTPPACSALGAAFGRFEITGPGSGTSQVSILYLLGNASGGVTGGKGGAVGLNVGQQSDGTVDPNPRLTLYTR